MIGAFIQRSISPTIVGKQFALLDARKTIPAARDQRGINRHYPSRIGDQNG
jgi:hypothetical protein